MPKVSVIVPVYKVEKYLHHCVDSILAQTFTDFELLLVDDGSPDTCGAICDAYAAKDNRIHVFHQKNSGVSAARNFGIDWALQNSNSEWITFLDSDDWCHPMMLEILYQAATETGSKVSVCGYINTSGEEPDVDLKDVRIMQTTPEQLFTGNHVGFVVPWGKLYSKESISDIRYPVGKRFEDEYTTYRILFQYEHVAHVNVPLYYYRTNPDGFMHMQWSLSRLDYFNAAKEHILFYQRIGKLDAMKKSIRLYAHVLVEHHQLYLKGKQNRHIDRTFQALAWYYIRKYHNKIELDTERKVQLLWAALPGLSKVYHCIKNILSK